MWQWSTFYFQDTEVFCSGSWKECSVSSRAMRPHTANGTFRLGGRLAKYHRALLFSQSRREKQPPGHGCSKLGVTFSDVDLWQKT